MGISLSKTVKAEPSSTAKEPVTEEEIRAVFMEKKQVTTQDLVIRFKSRVQTREEKIAFAAIVKKIAKIQKNTGSKHVVVLREI